MSDNPYLAGNFAPVRAETTVADLQVRGAIPPDLAGRLLRIGPNPVAPNPTRYHWFTGTGMVHGLRLRDGRAEWYRNRYVVDAEVSRAQGRDDLPGPRRHDRDNTVNTNVVEIAGRAYALVEAGSLPVELTDELDSVARADFGGTLEGGFTAHPKRDPLTGVWHAITYMPGEPLLRHVAVSPDGIARIAARVPAPHGPMVHDTAVTTDHVVVLDLPVIFSLDALRDGGFPYAWSNDQPPRVGLLPKAGGPPRWFEAPACYVYHVMNAYDDSGTTVLDVIRHPRSFDRNRQGPTEGTPVLARWTIDRASGRLTENIADDRGCEFPRINEAFTGRPHRFGYTASYDAASGHGPARKHRRDDDTSETHDYGPGRATLEPVFVPRSGGTEEDDGWIMSYVYDAGRDASDVVILDARDFAGPPVATIQLPVRVPFGFHGNWLPDAQGAAAP